MVQAPNMMAGGWVTHYPEAPSDEDCVGTKVKTTGARPTKSRPLRGLGQGKQQASLASSGNSQIRPPLLLFLAHST